MQGFYQDLLGFRWSDTIGDFFVFLRCNADHHAANFLESTKLPGMHHIAYEMRDLEPPADDARPPGRNEYRLHWGPGGTGRGTTSSPTTATPTATSSSCSPSSTR